MNRFAILNGTKYSRMDCLQQILLRPFLNTLTQMKSQQFKSETFKLLNFNATHSIYGDPVMFTVLLFDLEITFKISAKFYATKISKQLFKRNQLDGKVAKTERKILLKSNKSITFFSV